MLDLMRDSGYWSWYGRTVHGWRLYCKWTCDAAASSSCWRQFHLGNELQFIFFGLQHSTVHCLSTGVATILCCGPEEKKKANPEGLNANTFVPRVAVDMWQSSTSREGTWKSPAAQFKSRDDKLLWDFRTRRRLSAASPTPPYIMHSQNARVALWLSWRAVHKSLLSGLSQQGW